MKRLQTYLVTKARHARWQRKGRIRRGISGRAAWGVAALVASLLALGMIWLGWQYVQITRDLPAISDIPGQLNAQSATFTQPTRLVDRSGTVVVKDLSVSGVQRKYMRISGLGSKISPDFVNAMVAVVEPGFWSSSGMNLRNWDRESHSTIAERLVFHMLLEQEPASFERTLREKLLAGQVVSTYGREQVLEWYLNSLDFGHLAYGVEAGAQLYFGVSADNLSLPQAALLAGVAAAPALNPWDSPAGARTVQVEALKAMALQHVITTDILRTALTAKTEFTSPTETASSNLDPFAEKVVAQLEHIIGRERVERGGLLIQTSLDSSLQKNLECAIQTQLQSLEGNSQAVLNAARSCDAARLLPLLPPGDSPARGELAAAAIVTDPASGQVLAFTGEIDSSGSGQSLQSHAGGTIFTPFIYLNAFSQGLSPATLVWDAPVEGNTSEPVNLDGQFHGPMRMRIALANDYLQPLVSVLRQTGWYSLTRLTNGFGLNVQDSDTLQELLDQPVSIGELATAYNIFAASGARYGRVTQDGALPDLDTVLKVWDENGKVIYDGGQPDSAGVISGQLAYLINASLSDDLARQPTLGTPSMLLLGQSSAAKIGQTKTGDQVWTAGYTPERTVVVWMGKNADMSSTLSVDPRWAVGIWRAAIQTATQGLTNSGFNPPAGVSQVTVCDPSGLLPTVDCPGTADEVFISGNEPTTLDTLYKKLQVNAETGRLATVFTPADMMVEKVYMDVPAEYQAWAGANGLDLMPTSYDVLQSVSTDPAVHITSPAMFGLVHGKVKITGTASANTFVSYEVQIGQGLNPRSWQQIKKGEDHPVVEGALAEWDTTGLDGLYVIRLQVLDKQNVVKTALLQVSVDNTAPAVRISLPADGAIIDRASTPQVFVKVDSEAGSDLARVEIRIDGVLVATLDSAPYFYSWPVKSGKHTLQASGFDEVGNKTDSPPVVVEVQ